MLNKFTFKEFRNKKTRIMVTPEMAKELLSRNLKGNRNVSETTVRGYARDMKRGQWKHFSPSRIVVSNRGNLLDGQHRLFAIIMSGVTIGFFFDWDVDEEMFFYIDNGKKRSASDFVNGKYKTERTALAKSALMLEHGNAYGLFDGKGPGSSTNSVYSPSRKEISDRANEDDDIYEASVRGKKINGAVKGISAKSASTFCYIVYICEGTVRNLDAFIAELCDPFTMNISARACQNACVDLKLKTQEGYRASHKLMCSTLLKGYSNYLKGSTAKRLTKIEECGDAYKTIVDEVVNG